jgi:hypothetical protein
VQILHSAASSRNPTSLTQRREGAKTQRATFKRPSRPGVFVLKIFAVVIVFQG